MPRLELVLAREASADFEEITAFSNNRFGEMIADAYVSGLEIACEQLCDFPSLAPVVHDLHPEIRCFNHRSHRIFYRVEPTQVLIVRILHQSRATPTAL